jgi:hypothetical protein
VFYNPQATPVIAITSTQLIYLATTVVASAVIGFVIYYVAGRMKGRVEVALERYIFAPGEEIHGSVVLASRKPVQINKIVLAVVALRRKSARQIRRRGRTSREVYRSTTELEVEGVFEPGEFHSFPFVLTAPDLDNRDTGGLLGTLAHFAQNLEAGTTGQVIWRIEARVDAAGIDLFGKKTMRIE